MSLGLPLPLFIRESYGVDIEHSPTDRSNHNSDDDFVDDDDGYEDSFINDDELQFSSPGSPVFSSKGNKSMLRSFSAHVL